MNTSSSSSSFSEESQVKKKFLTRHNRYFSVKNNNYKKPLEHKFLRSSLRVKKPTAANSTQEKNFYEYRPKSQSLLTGGNGIANFYQPFYFHPSQNGSLDSLQQLNTAATTLTNVSMTSLMPFQVTNMPKHNVRVNNLKAKWNNVNRDVIYILYEIYNKAKRLRHNLSTQAFKEYDVLTDHIVQSFANNQTQILNQSMQNLNNNSKYKL